MSAGIHLISVINTEQLMLFRAGMHKFRAPDSRGE
jgi:hypothetical protein